MFVHEVSMLHMQLAIMNLEIASDMHEFYTNHTQIIKKNQNQTKDPLDPFEHQK